MKTDIFKERKKNIADLILNNELYVPMKTKEIAILLGIPKDKRYELQEVLDALVADGTIGVSKKGKYMKPDNVALIGTFESTSRGFGFVSVEGQDEDIFIKASDTKNAFYHDKVKIVITLPKKGDKRAEGKVIDIVDHEIKTLVGTYQRNKNFGFVVPDNQKIACDIFVSKEHEQGAVTGSKVIVKITDYGKGEKNPEGRITEVIGHIDDPGTDIMSIVKAYDLPEEFPDSVKKQLKSIPDEVDEKDKAGSTDLRDVVMVTIDGEDSNDRVIPMIPHQLSNGICSLNEGCDRLALSCLMDINSKGVVVGHKICESVINVDRRMTYTSVKKILEDNDANEIEKYKELIPMFKLMEEAAALLRKKRFARGSIDFDFPESKIVLDTKGHPVKIEPYDRNVATKLIEDFMLVANETVAEDYFWQEVPFLYRTHENPDPEKIIKLSTFINNFGYSMHITDEIHPKELQKLLEKISGSDEENLISRLTLRSMKKAKYTPECIGHFGLAAKYYCHFTSPIRRYPDLQIHRIIKECLHGGMSEKRKDHYYKILPDVAEPTSATERRADEAERDTDKLKMVEYMEQFKGEKFSGVISGVTNWGIYVELPNTIEGMVSVNDMPGFYIFDENHYEMVNETTHKTYKLGQKVDVVTIGTNKIARTIDFMFAEDYDDRYN